MRRFHSLIAFSVFAMSLLPWCELQADTQGIHVALKIVNDLYFYKNHQALVVGINDYEKWPRLPYAVSDARETAQQKPPVQTAYRKASTSVSQPQTPGIAVENQASSKASVKTTRTELPKQQETASLHVPEVKPDRGLGALMVTGNVPDARVCIDRKEVSFWALPEEAWMYRGTAPFETHELAQGRHEVRVHQDGYLEEVKIVHINAGETLKLKAMLFESLSMIGDEVMIWAAPEAPPSAFHTGFGG